MFAYVEFIFLDMLCCFLACGYGWMCPLCYWDQLFVYWGFHLWTEAGSFSDTLVMFIIKVCSNENVMVNVGNIILVKILS
jgi:hypothetical protein